MPMYDWLCRTGHYTEGWGKAGEDYGVCKKCSAQSKKIWRTAPAVNGDTTDFDAYESPATGTWIDSRKAEREELARTGCHILEAGEAKHEVKRRAQQDAACDLANDEIIERHFGEVMSN